MSFSCSSALSFRTLPLESNRIGLVLLGRGHFSSQISGYGCLCAMAFPGCPAQLHLCLDGLTFRSDTASPAV